MQIEIPEKVNKICFKYKVKHKHNILQMEIQIKLIKTLEDKLLILNYKSDHQVNSLIIHIYKLLKVKRVTILSQKCILKMSINCKVK
jgi:hypothetical protein